MSLRKPVRSRRRSYKPRVANEALSVLCLVVACGSHDDPFALPNLAEAGTEADPTSSPDDTTEDANPVDAGAVRSAVVDAGKTSADAGRRALDAGASNATVPMLTDDAGLSFECAAEFAGCVLENVLAADQCLDTYAECEPGFRTNDAGIDGTCAVHFSACVLGDPLGFERCLPMLAECEN